VSFERIVPIIQRVFLFPMGWMMGGLYFPSPNFQTPFFLSKEGKVVTGQGIMRARKGKKKTQIIHATQPTNGY
jgi:hypothetical protein